MILEPAVCRAIDAGKKTMIRRPVVATEPRYRDRKTKHGDPKRGASKQLVTPFRPKVGDRWPIKPGVSKPVMCRVVVTAVREEQHGAINLADAYLEGHKTTAAYRAAWVRSHDQQWIAQVGDEIDPLQDDELLPRFEARWASRPVWVVTFKVDRGGAVYLAADPAAMQTDYVTSPARAMAGEPEVNYDTEWLEQRARNGRDNLNAHRQETAAEEAARCELLELHERLRKVAVLAGRHGVDISKDLFVIGQRIEKLEAKLHQRPAA